MINSAPMNRKTRFHGLILGAIIVIPLLAGAEPTQTEESDLGEAQSDLGEAPSKTLGLIDWMKAFRTVDPLQRDAALQRSIASLAVERSENPQGIDLSLDAGANGSLWAWSSGTDPLGQAGLDLDQASLSGRDARGHRWALTGAGRIGLPGSTSRGGSSASLSGALYGSVTGNHQGRLYELEARYLSLDKQAAASHEEEVIRRRCWLSVDLYVGAWNLQEQLGVVNELLETRKTNRKQTEREHRRGMVPKLDYLSAQSDVIRAERRREVLSGHLQSALASLGSFLEQPPKVLEDPRPQLEELLKRADPTETNGFESHPSIVAANQLQEARLAQSNWVGQKYKPMLELGPQVQVGTQNHQIDPLLQETQGLSLSGGVAMHLTVPVSAPAQHYEQSILHEQAELAQADKDETLRALTERRTQALARLQSAKDGTALVEQQLTLIDAQVREAWSRFVNGRLEYQDYLLHYTQYEEARLAALELELAELQSRIILAEISSEQPEMCQ